MNDWIYLDEPFTKDKADMLIAEGYLGFVYEIHDVLNGMKYIGKKLLTTTIKRPPLKGQKRKRKSVVHSDWEKYHGSSETVKEQVALRPNDFFRTILYFAKMKGELSYMEAKIQFDKQVLLKSEYYNGIIQVRINKSHVKCLWLDEST